MRTNKAVLIFIIIMIAAIAGLGAYLIISNNNANAGIITQSQLAVPQNANNPPPVSYSLTQINTSALISDPSVPNGCSYITAAMIQDSLGLMVNEGVSVKSPVQDGTSCVFKNDDSSTGIVLQKYPDTLAPYNTAVWSGITELTGVGDSAFVQAPSDGVANAEVLKNHVIVYVNVYSTTSYNADQLTNLLKAITVNI